MKRNKALSLLGLFGPVYFFLLITFLTPLWPGYDPISEFVSILGSKNSPYQSLANIAGFAVLGIIVVFFAANLLENLQSSTYSRLGTHLLRASGATIILMGLFPAERYDIAQSLSGVIHHYVSILAFFLIPASILTFARAFIGDAKWGHGFAIISGSLGVLALVCGVYVGIFFSSPYGGLVERIGVALFLLWIFLISTNLFIKYRIDEILG